MSKLLKGITLGTLAIAATIISSSSPSNASKNSLSKPENSLLKQRTIKTKPSSTTSTTSPATEVVEESVFQKINAYRQTQGLAPLARNSIIDTEARLHSQNMASGVVPFGHTGFETRIKTISLTINLTSASENVAWNQGYSDPATTAVNGWLNSPGHLANIKGNFNMTGIGVAKNSNGAYYLTQIFIKTP